jgi:hypothetical protein
MNIKCSKHQDRAFITTTLFTQLYVSVDIVLKCRKQWNYHMISVSGEVCAYMISNSTTFIEVLVPIPEMHEVSIHVYVF